MLTPIILIPVIVVLKGIFQLNKDIKRSRLETTALRISQQRSKTKVDIPPKSVAFPQFTTEPKDQPFQRLL